MSVGVSPAALKCLRQRRVGRVLSRYRGRLHARIKAGVVEGAAPSPLAGHAVNPSLEARWRHPCRHRSRKRQGPCGKRAALSHVSLRAMAFDEPRRSNLCS
ncbi:hypothetical protein XFF6992_350031 [Xanthomonas citri pv. fuscans]|nr:hypothetical protein XFF6992_350031 [Xanthomonas citri pv. fuscans]SOO33481.1 hypothetical protein XFF6994_2880004 [Xanthomonas citri pv. fuscans]